MTAEERASVSYLVRVVEPAKGGSPKITVQNLKSGEMHSFDSWSAFVSFAEREPRAGSLK
jgi:hypothetical protein